MTNANAAPSEPVRDAQPARGDQPARDAQRARGEHRAELIALLGEIAEMVTNARAMPMSSSVLVNREDISNLVERAQAALPGELATADAILADADSVLRRAHEEKAEILQAAQKQAAEMVSREKVVLKAQEEAKQIISNAKAEARKIAQSTDDWCDRRLAEVEIDVEALGKQIQAGRARLAERMGQVPPGTAEHLGQSGSIE